MKSKSMRKGVALLATTAALALGATTAGAAEKVVMAVPAFLTGAGAPISVRPDISGHSGDAELTLNARVHVDPEALQQIVRAALEAVEQAGTRVTIRRMASFRPGRPEPVHRFDAPV